jgi:hypothetical protein
MHARVFLSNRRCRLMSRPWPALPFTATAHPTILPCSHNTASIFYTSCRVFLAPALISQSTHSMAGAVESIGCSAFDEATAQFVEWFTTADGTRLSSKVLLKDMRSANAGRGAGMPMY